MIITQTRMASLLLAFGIFFTTSCAHFTSDKNSRDRTSLKNYQQALTELLQEIEESPDSLQLKIRKAEILGEIAKKTPGPALRTPYYRNLHDTVQEINYQTGKNAEANQIAAQAWTFEQSQGVTLLQRDDSDTFERHFNSIIAHFDNATTIIPDSLVTYSLKATTYYRHGEVSNAIETLEKANEAGDYSDLSINEKLAYLYLEAGDMESAINRYQFLNEQDADNHHYKSGLANAYILNEQHEDALPIIRELTEDFPTRPEYQEALGTELYFLFNKKINAILEELEANQLDRNQFEEIMTSLDEIIEIFNSLESKLPTLENGTERVASFYKNAALKLSQLTAVATEELQTELKNKETELFEKSLPLWQKLAETNPENQDYRKNLYQVYLALEMEDDAEALERSLNF